MNCNKAAIFATVVAFVVAGATGIVAGDEIVATTNPEENATTVATTVATTNEAHHQPAGAADAPRNCLDNQPDNNPAKTLPEKIVAWYADHLNHGSIALLMAVESSFIPFPSEIVVPPAAYAACDPGSPLCVTGNRWLDVALVVLSGTVGALVGALVNYFLALIFGRPLVNWFAESRLGNACLINAEKVEKAEKFFVRYGIFSTFFGRLVPVVRQLISLPAGLAKMRLLPFVVFTFFGAAIWNCVLAGVGLWASGRQEIVNEYSRELSAGILVCAVLFCAFLLSKFLFFSKNKVADSRKTNSTKK